MPFRVSRPEGVLVRELSGEAVILNLETESYFGLDEMGARMWAALMRSPSVDEAQRMLLEEFAVDPEELRADLAAFIDELAAAGLVRVDEA
jgi:hypothetical protein